MMSNNVYRSERGATLVEVIASFVILVILLVSFFTFFIQTKQTTKNSEEIVDATYIAQTEMEKIYRLSTNNSKSNAEISITKDINAGGLGYTKECTGYESQANYTLYKNEQKTNPNVTIILKLTEKKKLPVTLTNAQIKVYVTKGNNKIDNICVKDEDIKQRKKAQIENIIEWKAGS